MIVTFSAKLVYYFIKTPHNAFQALWRAYCSNLMTPGNQLLCSNLSTHQYNIYTTTTLIFSFLSCLRPHSQVQISNHFQRYPFCLIVL